MYFQNCMAAQVWAEKGVEWEVLPVSGAYMHQQELLFHHTLKGAST
jgi:hypothetical protein